MNSADVVHPPEAIAAPPDLEGTVTDVTLKARDVSARRDAAKACQQCSGAVQIHDEHVKALVRAGDRFYRPVFCDPSCWASWASSGSG